MSLELEMKRKYKEQLPMYYRLCLWAILCWPVSIYKYIKVTKEMEAAGKTWHYKLKDAYFLIIVISSVTFSLIALGFVGALLIFK